MIAAAMQFKERILRASLDERNGAVTQLRQALESKDTELVSVRAVLSQADANLQTVQVSPFFDTLLGLSCQPICVVSWFLIAGHMYEELQCLCLLLL